MITRLIKIIVLTVGFLLPVNMLLAINSVASEPGTQLEPIPINNNGRVAQASRLSRSSSPDLDTLALSDWLTISANTDFSHRKTNFYKHNHNTAFLQMDSRLELWLPPYRRNFSWGPYLRLAVVSSNRDEAFENAWLARPGYGFQAYPFSFSRFRKPESLTGKLLGPVRTFFEYNSQDYWGSENKWRPDEQTRIGFDYYKAVNVNKNTKPCWIEIFNMLIWQSANEFDPDYNSIIFANALRTGVRIPRAGILSMFTPYLVIESSLTENPNYFWENRLLLGSGIRFAPDLRSLPHMFDWLSRFVIFTEYLDVTDYYRKTPSEAYPDKDVDSSNHDFRIGISISIGDFYK